MKLRKELERAPVRSLALRDAILVEPYTVLRAAVALMRTKSLGCAIIVAPGQIPTGIFTERSVLEVLAKDACLDSRPVGEFADSSFYCVREDDPISVVWDAVQRRGARFVCVTDRLGRAIGLAGQRSLSEFVAECLAKQVTVQRLGEKPWMCEREGA